MRAADPRRRARVLTASLAALASSWALAQPAPAATSPRPDAAALYATHCASCHGASRLGAMGPALLPENLGRLRKAAATQMIRDGRVATQMSGFADRLTAVEIAALVDYVYTPPAQAAAWTDADIRASRVVHADTATLPSRPSFATDPMNLFVVVEAGDHHVTVLDGDRLAPITRFPSRFALHGGPKFSPDGRYVYFASRDGWISKYDLWNLKMLVEVRAGINTRNAAVSGDGRYVIVGNYLPHTLVLLDARDLSLIRVIPVGDGKGASSRVSAVYDAAPRSSFIVALKDIPEAWEIFYSDTPPVIYDGLVHDYRLGEGVAQKGPFPIRRIRLDDVLDDFFFDTAYRHLIGAARDARKGQVVNLDVRRRIAEIDIPGMPHLGSGISWEWQGRPVMASTNLEKGMVTVIDMKTWKTVKQIATLGPGFFLRSHERTDYLWVDNFNSQDRNALQVIDKRTLEVVKTLRAAPGQTLAHVEFTRDGRYALASLWEDDGALIVYDAATLEEVKRLPMRKPVGKYNVHNKVTRSAGTSH